MKEANESKQALLRAAQALVGNALDWDGESEFVDVLKQDLDDLAAALTRAKGRA